MRCHCTVPLKPNVTLQECEQLKNLLTKGHDTCFTHEYSYQTKRDEYLQAKWVPRPLISKLFNCLHYCEKTLHLSVLYLCHISRAIIWKDIVSTSSRFQSQLQVYLVIMSPMKPPKPYLLLFSPNRSR